MKEDEKILEVKVDIPMDTIQVCCRDFVNQVLRERRYGPSENAVRGLKALIERQVEKALAEVDVEKLVLEIFRRELVRVAREESKVAARKLVRQQIRARVSEEKKKALEGRRR